MTYSRCTQTVGRRYQIMTQLINIHKTAECTEDLMEVKMTALKKKTGRYKMQQPSYSLITHTAKTVVRILRTQTERKIQDVLGEHQFKFTRVKGTSDATGMLRISEQTCKTEEELFVCFTD
jgi:chloramphenicol O-acetyltransferase